VKWLDIWCNKLGQLDCACCTGHPGYRKLELEMNKLTLLCLTLRINKSFHNLDCRVKPGNTKGGSITVLLTSCLTGLD